jgi:hypothetical protein
MGDSMSRAEKLPVIGYLATMATLLAIAGISGSNGRFEPCLLPLGIVVSLLWITFHTQSRLLERRIEQLEEKLSRFDDEARPNAISSDRQRQP